MQIVASFVVPIIRGKFQSNVFKILKLNALESRDWSGKITNP